MGSDFNWLERKFLPIALLLPIVVVVFTFTELRYLAFGETTQGSVVSFDAIEEPRGQSKVAVGYKVREEYVDSADDQSEFIDARMGRTWDPDEEETISVQYIPGSKETGRLASTGHRWIAASILVVTVILTLLAVKAGIEANRPIRPRR